MSETVHRKIVDGTRLAQMLRDQRENGATVVQCHGCFDIVHPGHLRYLQFARQLGDILVVSLTGDAGVEKGPDRPYIPQELRAENLAALEMVDWVVIDPHPTAAELLSLLKPDVYVKGREYATNSDPRFARERAIVESYGGRVVFHSGEVVFSSTRLIEDLAGDEELDGCRLRALCERHGISLGGLRRLLADVGRLRVVVIGDALCERYVTCDPDATAGDAPMMSLTRVGDVEYWGGAATLAAQLAALGAATTLICPLADGPRSAALRSWCRGLGVELADAPQHREPPLHTTFLADDTKLLRVCEGPSLPLDSAGERAAVQLVAERMAGTDLLVWCDSGYGAVTPGLVGAVADLCRRQGPVMVGHAPERRGALEALRKADLLLATERRLREVMHDMGSSLPSVTWSLLNRTRGRAAIVLMHRRGLLGFDTGDRGPDRDAEPGRLRSEFVPLVARHNGDLAGAEQVALALAGAALSVGASLPQATYLAAAGTGLALRRPGPSAVPLNTLTGWLDTRAELRPRSRFLPDASTVGDLARLAPPLPPIEAAVLGTGPDNDERTEGISRA